MLEKFSKGDFTKIERPSVATLDEINKIKELCKNIYIDDKIYQYIIDLVSASRAPNDYGLDLEQLIELGASPRASIALFNASRAEALLSNKEFVVPQHVKAIAPDVLRHRIMPTYEAEAQGLSSDDLVQIILDGVTVP